MLVDDEPLIRTAVSRLLGAAGYRVVVAAGPEQALALLAESGSRISLLVSDINMPGMDGLELARRATAMQPALRTLFLCGSPLEAIEGLPAGAQFLEKPFTQETLLRAVRELLAA